MVPVGIWREQQQCSGVGSVLTWETGAVLAGRLKIWARFRLMVFRMHSKRCHLPAPNQPKKPIAGIFRIRLLGNNSSKQKVPWLKRNK